MPTVLVIDDDLSVRKALQQILKRGRFGVFLAADAPTGLKLFDRTRFDAVILDIFMPGIEGFATLKAMRAMRPGVPVVAISGRPLTATENGAPDFLAMAVKLGAARALQKPFRAEQLFTAIEQSLAEVDLSHSRRGTDQNRELVNAAPPPPSLWTSELTASEVPQQ